MRAICIGDLQITASAKHIICDDRCYFTDKERPSGAPLSLPLQR
jgi:hypothetical protein